MSAKPLPDPDGGRVSKRLRLHPDTVTQAVYWAKKEGLSENEYMVLAIEEKVARANNDYNLPTLEIQRVNQMVDEVKALSTNVANLEAVVTSGFDSLLGLTRGDGYLLDVEDGELADTGAASAAAGG